MTRHIWANINGRTGAEEALMLLSALQQAFLLLKLRQTSRRGRSVAALAKVDTAGHRPVTESINIYDLPANEAYLFVILWCSISSLSKVCGVTSAPISIVISVHLDS